jgi:hypothetical protein
MTSILRQFELTLFWRNAWENDTHRHVSYLNHPATRDFIDFAAKPDILLNGDIKWRHLAGAAAAQAVSVSMLL